MNFEEIRACWAAEKQQDMYSINQSAVEQLVERKKVSAHRFTDRTEKFILFVNLAVSPLLLVLWFTKDEPKISALIVGLLMLGMAGYIVVARRARLRAQANFSQNLRDGLEQAISDTRYRVRLSSLGLWYILLVAVATVGSFVEGGGYSWLAYALLLCFFAGTYWAGRWEHRRFHRGKLNELEALREDLAAHPEV